jgi:hypothetical protein
MWNNVVIAACQSLSAALIAAFRFNFRGVGKSGGTFGGGSAEQADVKAALDLVSSTSDIDPGRIGLVGYSFGGSVSLPVALKDERVRFLALVSPALTDSGWDQLEQYHRPVLVLAGSADSIVRTDRLQKYSKGLQPPAQYQMVPGADHFWLDHEAELSRILTDFFVDGLKSS